MDTVGKNKKKIEEYIRNQLQEDIASDQMSLFETVDPFTGEKYKKAALKPLKGWLRVKCSWQTFLSPLKGQRQYHALIGLSQTTRFNGWF